MSTSSLVPPPSDLGVKEWADTSLCQIEKGFSADAISIISPITWGLEHRVRMAVEPRDPKREKLVVILDTPGGVVEVVERIVRVFRTFYKEVYFVVPDRAMSAGTILAMSGDAIFMDYHSVLGPIDPQVERDGKLVPALSYLAQFDRLNEKAKKGELTTAEAIMLQKLDLAELHQFELARDLTIRLLKEWLAAYKFKDWNETETRRISVTPEMRETRADEIARALNQHDRWLSHGRGISMNTLRDKLNLKIDDLSRDKELHAVVWRYLWFMRDHMRRIPTNSFVHSLVLF